MDSKEIKKVLKENGIDTRKISVKHNYCGYSEAYDITIKDININIEEVKKIVKQFERYECDERTLEILEGGNTYIHVEYDYDILKQANEKYNQEILNIIDKELSKRTEKEVDDWNNGEINPVLNLSKDVICYKDGKIQ